MKTISLACKGEIVECSLLKESISCLQVHGFYESYVSAANTEKLKVLR